jgi:hypothetical protein
MAGDPDLCHGGQPGCADPRTPVVDWGVAMWANGTTPNGDGLSWVCDDFRADDGQHPAAAGVAKVADRLIDFVTTDPVARTWFAGDPAPAVDCAGGSADAGPDGADAGDPAGSGGDAGASGQGGGGGCGCRSGAGRAAAPLALLALLLTVRRPPGRRRSAGPRLRRHR